MRPRKERPVFIKASQALRQKAVNFKTGLDLNMTDEVRGLIDAAIDQSKDTFTQDVLSKLRAMRTLAKEAEEDEFQRIFIMSNIADLAFDVKGMGGTFGFPLLSALAKSLQHFIQKIGLPNTQQFQVITIHIDALYLVLAQGVTGAGGDTEQELLETLRKAVEKTQIDSN